MSRVFWISRLHGPEAIDSAALRCLGIAAQKLTEGDEASAQQALDTSGPTRLSSDGVVLMRAVADKLGIGPLDLPWAAFACQLNFSHSGLVLSLAIVQV